MGHHPLASALLAPWWALQLLTGAKSFADNPLLGSPALNRRGLHVARVRLAQQLAAWRRRRLAHEVSPEDRMAFDSHGFVEIRDFLPPDRFESLRAALLNRAFPSREHRQGDSVTRRTAIGPAMLREIEGLADLLQGKRWTGLMHYVAATRSTPVYYLQTIFAGDPEAEFPDPQVHLHSDTFQPSLKAWFFLTDVPADGRPLTYVPGSHRLDGAREAWERYRSETVMTLGDRLSQRGSLRVNMPELPRLGLPEPHAFTVPANTLVVADTFGFHSRAESNRPTVRVEIWAYCRRSPFLPWLGWDLLSLPFFAARRAQWAAAIVDWLDARGWKKQHWHKAPARLPTER